MNNDVWCTEKVKGVDSRHCIKKRMTDTRNTVFCKYRITREDNKETIDGTYNEDTYPPSLTQLPAYLTLRPTPGNLPATHTHHNYVLQQYTCFIIIICTSHLYRHHKN